MSEELSIGIRKKPVPRNQRANLNRARQYKFEKGDAQDISVSLMDMDSAIMYYFENVIKPTVQENGEAIKMPSIWYATEGAAIAFWFVSLPTPLIDITVL